MKPALHNAMWPGLVGKGAGGEPPISLEAMLQLTAQAEVDGERFDGVDLFLSLPHIDIDSTDDDLKRLTAQLAQLSLHAGSLVAPVWEATGGGSAMGDGEARHRFLTQVRKACGIGVRLRDLGARDQGVIRIDSATSVEDWLREPVEGTKRIAETFQEACDIAEAHGERLAMEGEVCWGGMHSWRHALRLLEEVGRPEILGFQADMAHTMLFVFGVNAPEDRLLDGSAMNEPEAMATAYRTMASRLLPWTVDLHIAQNDGTVKGEGAHDKTGRHCLPFDPHGKLDIVRDAGAWMCDEGGQSNRRFSQICWDGCMFPNAVMMDATTWNDVLRVMIAVRKAHGWEE